MNRRDSLRLEIYDSIMEGAISSDEATELISVLEKAEVTDDKDKKDTVDEDKTAKKAALKKKIAIAAGVAGAAGATTAGVIAAKKALADNKNVSKKIDKLNDQINKLSAERLKLIGQWSKTRVPITGKNIPLLGKKD